MPRGTSATTTRRGRTTRARSDAGSVVGQITQLVSANETLRRENAELLAFNEQLRAQLAEIGSALGGLANGRGRRGGRGAGQPFVLADTEPTRTGKPIPHPEQLKRSRQGAATALGAA